MDVSHELALYKEMAEELKDYLLSNVMFWQMQGSSRFPKLSLGILLLTRARLAAVDGQLAVDQRAARDAGARQIDANLRSWRAVAEKKAGQELQTRVNLWQRFWEDCADDPRACADNYPHEVTARAIAGLLLREFPAISQSSAGRGLAAADGHVRQRLAQGEFVWPAELQPAFPETDFWYLYGRPHASAASAG